LKFWDKINNEDEKEVHDMSERVLSFREIEDCVKSLLIKYHAESALLFGSYARGQANGKSDIDLVVIGGPEFHATDIFALAEDLQRLINKAVDVYEIRELNTGTPFYENVMQDGVKIVA
jgi:predicted nucleotidyltransferase